MPRLGSCIAAKLAPPRDSEFLSAYSQHSASLHVGLSSHALTGFDLSLYPREHRRHHPIATGCGEGKQLARILSRLPIPGAANHSACTMQADGRANTEPSRGRAFDGKAGAQILVRRRFCDHLGPETLNRVWEQRGEERIYLLVLR